MDTVPGCGTPAVAPSGSLPVPVGLSRQPQLREAANAFVTPIPDPWYASPRNESDCLDSSPLALTVALDPPTAEGLLRAVAGVEGDVRAAVAANVVGAVVRFDGQVVEEFCDNTGTMQPAPPLELSFDSVEEWRGRWSGPGTGGPCPTHLHLRVGRKLPLSSAVGNAPLVGVLYVCLPCVRVSASCAYRVGPEWHGRSCLILLVDRRCSPCPRSAMSPAPRSKHCRCRDGVPAILLTGSPGKARPATKDPSGEAPARHSAASPVPPTGTVPPVPADRLVQRSPCHPKVGMWCRKRNWES